jgi:hypothetical protein
MAVEKQQDAAPQQDAKGKKKAEKPTDPDADLSEEDLELKRNIELLVERTQDKDAGIAKAALDSITKEIHSTTSSMTAVPKPLKFLRPHLEPLMAFFESMPAGPNRKTLADILSLMCSTVAGKEGERQGLVFKLQGHTDDLETWGHEYMRHLAGEISEEYKVCLNGACEAGAVGGASCDIGAHRYAQTPQRMYSAVVQHGTEWLRQNVGGRDGGRCSGRCKGVGGGEKVHTDWKGWTPQLLAGCAAWDGLCHSCFGSCASEIARQACQASTTLQQMQGCSAWNTHVQHAEQRGCAASSPPLVRCSNVTCKPAIA